MSDRSVILEKLRRVTLDKRDLPVLDPPSSHPIALITSFTENLFRMGGEVFPDGDDLATLVLDRYGRQTSVMVTGSGAGSYFNAACTTTPIVPFAGLDLVIVRAAFGVAETGSVCLTERELGVEALGYLPQHLLVLLDPTDIVVDLHAAYCRPEWRRARYGVLQSGPSATADIEGVLIRGAQGVRSLTVAFRIRSGEGGGTLATSSQGAAGASNVSSAAESGSEGA